jgi:hypothetical protein
MRWVVAGSIVNNRHLAVFARNGIQVEIIREMKPKYFKEKYSSKQDLEMRNKSLALTSRAFYSRLVGRIDAARRVCIFALLF